MKKLLTLTLFILCLSLAHAEEKIDSFDVTIKVNGDGSAVVTENITVTAEHRQINRGIFRDIPQSVKKPVTPVSLLMDGQPHPFFTEKRGTNLRVNFGDDNYIDQGQHTYAFTYDVKRAAGQFKDYDEIYWNITGNYWNFKIDKASATVILPQGATPIENKISLYTGAAGEKESNARKTGPLSFAVTAPLSAGEGFTIAVPWQKGFITLPPVPLLNRASFLVSAILIVLMAYCFIVWHFIGRDPQARVVRQYAPPKDISPAYARYLSTMFFDNKAFSVIIISLTLKGFLEISNKPSLYQAILGKDKNSFLGKLLGDNGPFVLKAVKRPYEVTTPLPAEELTVYNALFKSGNSFSIEQKNRSVLLQAVIDAHKVLDMQAGKTYFKRNFAWVLPALIPALFFAWKLSLIFSPEIVFITLFLGTIIFTIAASILSKSVKFTPAAILPVIFLFIVGGHLLSFTKFSSISVDPEVLWYVGGIVCTALIVVVFYKLVKAYTKEGRAIMDQIDGFKQYLLTAEEHRAAATNPADSQKIFCDYFPYAVALDAENKWINSFEASLGRSMVEDSMRSRGIMTPALITSAGLTSLGTSLSSSISASTASSRSGSGGGGSSGGGGGGGGGGGR